MASGFKGLKGGTTAMVSFNVVLVIVITIMVMVIDAGAAAPTVINVNPTSGVDASGCGVSSGSPCASIMGGLMFNNVSSNSGTQFELLLSSGVFSGENNRNISLPPNLVSVSGSGSDTMFVGEIFNVTTVVNSTYSFNTSTVVPFFNATSVSFSNLTFSGEFYTMVVEYEPPSETSYTSAIFLQLSQSTSAASFSNVTFTNINSYIGYPITAVLHEGASLYLSSITITSTTTQLFNVSSDVFGCPPIGYQFPSFIVDGFTAFNGSAGNTWYYRSLIYTWNVKLSFSNAQFTNWFGYEVINSDGGCWQNSSMPIANLYNVLAQNSGFYGVFNAPILTASNLVFIDNQLAFGGIVQFVVGNVTNATFTRNVFVQQNSQYVVYGLISIYYAWNPCYYNQTNCGQAPTFQMQSYLSQINISSNTNLTGLTASWNTGNTPSEPATPFTSVFAQVFVDSSTFSNNNFVVGSSTSTSVLSGALIQGFTTVTDWQSTNTGGTVLSNSTFYNVLTFTNSMISGNTVTGSSGGAVFLSGTSLQLIDSTIENNTAYVSANSFLLPEIQICELNGNQFGGGGAIFAEYNSQIELNSSSISNNNVLGSGSNINLIGGGVLCCPNGGDVRIILDLNSTFSNNSANYINNFACSNSIFFETVPTCNVTEPTNGCDHGKTRLLPIVLIAVGAVLALAIALFFGIRLYRRRRASYESI